MSEAWIETAGGTKFDILDTRPEMIQIDDIAHALSQMNRFTGHCKFPYPVAQHSRLGSYLIHPDYALQFLLHDASESFLGDMNRPMKHYTEAGKVYRVIEHRIQRIIYKRFGCSAQEHPLVKDMDDEMLYAEKAQLMGDLPWETRWGKSDKAADVKIVETSFRENKRLFLERFYQLYKPR